MLGWLEALPDEVIRARPVLSAHYAGTLLSTAGSRASRPACADAERWLDPTARGGEVRPNDPSTRMVVVDEGEFRDLPASIAIYRAGLAQAVGDVAGTMRLRPRALDLVDEDDHLRRGSAAALLALAYWTSGDLEAAHRSYADGMAAWRRPGTSPTSIGCAIALADIRIAQGRLRDAMRTYEQGLQLANGAGRARAAGGGGHARGHERAAPRARRPRRRVGSTC